jgi:hypothetical protein
MLVGMNSCLEVCRSRNPRLVGKNFHRRTAYAKTLVLIAGPCAEAAAVA